MKLSSRLSSRSRLGFVAMSLIASLMASVNSFAGPAESIPAAKEFSQPLSAPNYKKLLADMTVLGGRKPSAEDDVQVTEQILSEKFRELRDGYFQNVSKASVLESASDSPSGTGKGAVALSQKLDAFIKKVEIDYPTYKDTDAKFFAINLIALKPYRSIFYRIRPLLESSNAKMAHSMIVTSVRQLASAIQTYLPTEQWHAGFQYISEPFDGKEKMISSDQDLHQYLIAEVMPAVRAYISQMEALSFQSKICWDNRIMFGPSGFAANSANPSFKSDTLDRFRGFGEGERLGLLAGGYSQLAALEYTTAYSLNGLMKIWQELGMLYGIDSYKITSLASAAMLLSGTDTIEGAPASDRTTILQQYKGQFLHKLTGGDRWTQESLRSMIKANQYAHAAWKALQNQPASQRNVLDPAVATAFSRQINLSFDDVDCLLAGPCDLVSITTGDAIRVNFAEFMNNPPLDLLDFLPNRFDHVDLSNPRAGSEMTKTLGGKTVTYRNFHWGSATGWDVTKFAPYFPKLAEQGGVSRAARTMSQTWGGGVIGFPMALIIQ